MSDLVRLSYCKLSGSNTPLRIGEDDVPLSFSASRYVVFKPCTGSFSNIWKIIGFNAWSPIVFVQSYRRKANFKMAQVIGLDFDDGEFTLENAKEWIIDNDFQAIIGLTKSHQKMKDRSPPCDRFRMILNTVGPCFELDKYEYTVKRVIQETGADKSCKDAARFFYPCTEQYFIHHGTKLLNWLDVPFEESIDYKKIINARINQFDHRNIEKIPPLLWGHILWGCKPPGRHRLCYIIGAGLGLRGFTPYEIVKLIEDNKSPLLAIGVEEVRRAVVNGSARALSEL